MAQRVIVIGDVHGCTRELEKLLQRVAPRTGDDCVFLGDLINRGPDSLGAIDLARSLGAVSLLGNHEHRLRSYRHTRDLSLLKEEDLPTLSQLRASDWDFLEQMPLHLEKKELGMLFVHGGFLPGIPWRKQSADVVTRIQVVDKKGRPLKRTECMKCPIWADLWKGPPYVVYGHTPRDRVYKSEWAMGIDTGCVYGGHLTALILPERRLVQVKALRRYWR
jgi:hypothetical protein